MRIAVHELADVVRVVGVVGDVHEPPAATHVGAVGKVEERRLVRGRGDLEELQVLAPRSSGTKRPEKQASILILNVARSASGLLALCLAMTRARSAGVIVVVSAVPPLALPLAGGTYWARVSTPAGPPGPVRVSSPWR